jgi:hypothetical protein
MSLLELIVALVLVGLALWAINTFIPMEPSIKKLLNVTVIVILVIWILQGTGILGSLGAIRIR